MVIRTPDESYVEARLACVEGKLSEFQQVRPETLEQWYGSISPSLCTANTCHAAIGGSWTRFGGAIGTTGATGGAGGAILDW
jgi:hypothetical protein